MTDVFKVLGQVAPVAATPTTLYTVPALTSTVVSSIYICNTSATAADTYSVSVRVAGAGTTAKQSLFSNCPIDASDTFVATSGLSLATTDVVTCYSTNGTTVFNLFGVEVT